MAAAACPRLHEDGYLRCATQGLLSDICVVSGYLLQCLSMVCTISQECLRVSRKVVGPTAGCKYGQGASFDFLSIGRTSIVLRFAFFLQVMFLTSCWDFLRVHPTWGQNQKAAPGATRGGGRRIRRRAVTLASYRDRLRKVSNVCLYFYGQSSASFLLQLSLKGGGIPARHPPPRKHVWILRLCFV